MKMASFEKCIVARIQLVQGYGPDLREYKHSKVLVQVYVREPQHDFKQEEQM